MRFCAFSFYRISLALLWWGKHYTPMRSYGTDWSFKCDTVQEQPLTSFVATEHIFKNDGTLFVNFSFPLIASELHVFAFCLQIDEKGMRSDVYINTLKHTNSLVSGPGFVEMTSQKRVSFAIHRFYRNMKIWPTNPKFCGDSNLDSVRGPGHVTENSEVPVFQDRKAITFRSGVLDQN